MENGSPYIRCLGTAMQTYMYDFKRDILLNVLNGSRTAKEQNSFKRTDNDLIVAKLFVLT